MDNLITRTGLHRVDFTDTRPMGCTACRGHCQTRDACELPEPTKPASRAAVAWACFLAFIGACIFAAWVAPSFVPF